MSEVLRYITMENEVKVVSRAKKISGLILRELENDGIQIGDCCGQTYDNAAVMAGHRSGVQKRISEINPKALFVPRTNHSLNLACLHATLGFHAELRGDSVTDVIEFVKGHRPVIDWLTEEI